MTNNEHPLPKPSYDATAKQCIEIGIQVGDTIIVRESYSTAMSQHGGSGAVIGLRGNDRGGAAIPHAGHSHPGNQHRKSVFRPSEPLRNSSNTQG